MTLPNTPIGAAYPAVLVNSLRHFAARLQPLPRDEDPLLATILAIMDGGASVISTGVVVDIPVDFACRIVEWELLATSPAGGGSVVLDIYKVSAPDWYVAAPTSANKITGSELPTLTSARYARSSVLAGWETTVNDGDVLRVNVNSATGVTKLTLKLRVRRVSSSVGRFATTASSGSGITTNGGIPIVWSQT